MILEGTLKSGERLPAERTLAEHSGFASIVARSDSEAGRKGFADQQAGRWQLCGGIAGFDVQRSVLQLLESNPEAQRDLLEFRHTRGIVRYYAALRATDVDRERLTAAFEELQDCYSRHDEVSRAEEGAADAKFHLAIAEASHNAVLLHTIRGLFDLLKRNVVTNIGGMYKQRTETRDMLITQHRELYLAIIEGRAEQAREVSSRHILYVQEVLEEVRQEVQRMARAERRKGM